MLSALQTDNAWPCTDIATTIPDALCDTLAVELIITIDVVHDIQLDSGSLIDPSTY